jgi:hypothetical protein
MARQKFLRFPTESLDLLEPALNLLMGSSIGLPRDMPAHTSMLQRLFNGMRDDFEAKPGVLEILVMRALVYRVDLLAQLLHC